MARRTLGIILIVTKSINRKFKATKQRISLEDWLAIVRNDSELKLESAPSVAPLAGGMTVEIPALPGHAELLVNGVALPFLGFRRGELMMSYSPSMDDPKDPVRRKVAEVARKLNALITHDAGDEFLDW